MGLSSEKKIDLLDVRLRSIETTLQKLANSVSPSPQNSATRSESHDDAVISSSSENSPGNDSALLGDHTLKVQSAHANDFLEKAVTQGRVGQVNPSIRAALLKLQKISERQRGGPDPSRDQSFPLQRPVPIGGLCKLPMPPIAVVIDLLNKSSSLTPSILSTKRTLLITSLVDVHPTLFTYNCAFVGITDFIALCEALYASPETSSHTELTIVNAGLYYLFVEQDPSANFPTSQDDYQSLARLCQGNLEACIQSLPLFMSASTTNIQALLISVIEPLDLEFLVLLTILLLGGVRSRYMLSFFSLAPKQCCSRPLQNWRLPPL